MKPTTSVVVVLANLMSQKAKLNAETASRVVLGCEIAEKNKSDLILFIGWDYREDCETPIAIAMRNYAQTQNLARNSKCYVNTLSRDTVGDAILCYLQLSSLGDKLKLTVVTSDYHVDRSRYLFEKVWGQARIEDVVGAETSVPDRDTSESRSIKAFETTFHGVNFERFEEVQDCLLVRHPFYNGEAFPSRPFLKSRLDALADRPFGDW